MQNTKNQFEGSTIFQSAKPYTWKSPKLFLSSSPDHYSPILSPSDFSAEG